MPSPDHDPERHTLRDLFLTVVSSWATTLRVALLLITVVIAIWALSLDVAIGPVQVGAR